jgi:hypothetical protein
VQDLTLATLALSNTLRYDEKTSRLDCPLQANREEEYLIDLGLQKDKEGVAVQSEEKLLLFGTVNRRGF